jgi:hypothetical protein
MNTLAPSDVPAAVFIRKQKAISAPVVLENEDFEESSLGVGVGMHSPSMQRRTKSHVTRPVNANSGMITSWLSASSGPTKKVSFGLQSETSTRNAHEHDVRHQASPSFTENASLMGSKLSSNNFDGEVFRDQNAFLSLFLNTNQRELDTCIQFAMLGGPLVKHSSRAHRPPVLCNFRLINNCARLVWAEATRPEEEKYGLETSSISKVLVGAAAAAEIESPNTVRNIKPSTLRLVLLLEGDEKLRLEALDKVRILT